MGHRRVLSAPQFDGFVHMPPGMEWNTRFDLAFRLDQLEIDNTEYRSGLGKAFSTVLNQAAIDGTREHMLGEDNMQADRYPFVRIHSLQITGESPDWRPRSLSFVANPICSSAVFTRALWTKPLACVATRRLP